MRAHVALAVLLVTASFCAAEDFWTHKVTTDAEFDAFSTSVSTVMNLGKSLKFLVDNRNAGAPVTYIIDTNYRVNDKTPDYVQYHYLFAKKVLNVPEELEEFNQVTYFQSEKRYFAGTVQAYNVGTDDAAHRVYGIQLYPSDVAKEMLFCPWCVRCSLRSAFLAQISTLLPLAASRRARRLRQTC
eukprot:Opistho-2@77506